MVLHFGDGVNISNSQTIKSRHYCLTFFTEPTNELLEGVRYVIIGKEIAPTTKRLHWQAYIELYNSQRPSFIKRSYDNNGVHIERRFGTRNQARDYCKKDGHWLELGTWILGQGHRTDLDEIAGSLVKGETTIEEVMENAPTTYCRYRNGLKDLAALGLKKKTKKFRKVKVELVTGPTGAGKTRLAMETAQYKIEGWNLKWWADYAGERCICIDEYNNDIKITELLSLLDGYQLRLQQKGTHTYAQWDKIIITTNLKVHELHQNAKPAHKMALMRRITTIKNLWNEVVER